MNCRRRASSYYQATVATRREHRDGALDLAGIAHVDHAQLEGAAAGLMPTWAGPAAMAESRRTAARVTPGAISLSSSSHFAAMLYSNTTKPVALPPGRARLST